jgi:hypothetical protein
MRTLIVVALGVLLLAVVGWITFSHDGTKTSINLETNQIKRDTHQMLDSGSKMVRNAKESVATPTKPEHENSIPSRLDDSAVKSTSPSPAGTLPPQTPAATRTAGPNLPSNEQR